MKSYKSSFLNSMVMTSAQLNKSLYFPDQIIFTFLKTFACSLYISFGYFKIALKLIILAAFLCYIQDLWDFAGPKT